MPRPPTTPSHSLGPVVPLPVVVGADHDILFTSQSLLHIITGVLAWLSCWPTIWPWEGCPPVPLMLPGLFRGTEVLALCRSHINTRQSSPPAAI